MLPHGYGSVPRRQIPEQGVGRDSVEPVLKSQVSRFKFQAGCAVAAEVTRRTQGEFPDQGVGETPSSRAESSRFPGFASRPRSAGRNDGVLRKWSPRPSTSTALRAEYAYAYAYEEGPRTGTACSYAVDVRWGVLVLVLVLEPGGKFSAVTKRLKAGTDSRGAAEKKTLGWQAGQSPLGDWLPTLEYS